MALPDLPGVPKTVERGVRVLLEGLREHVRELRGFGGEAAARAITYREVTGGVGGGSVIVLPGGGGGGVYTPDPTPPPTPTGVVVTPTFANVIIEHDTPIYTVGHGHARTKVYGATYGGSGPLPVFADAVLITEFVGPVFAHATTLGTAWHLWVSWVSVDGYESTTPAGGANGYTATTGKVGTSDLGNAIVLSQNLAPGSVTADKALLDIGGDNLIGNNSFEVDADGNGMADGWAVYNNSADIEPHAVSRTPGRISGFAQRVTWPGANTSSKGLVGQDMTGARGGWTAGKTYVVSWYARSGTAQAYGMGLQWNVPPGTTVALKNPNLGTAWQRYAMRITWGGGVEPAGRFYISVAYGQPLTGWVEIDDVQVEEGDTLSGYTGKLAANTIVAGDGAIANFAVTNLLVANGAIDDLKVSNVSVVKLLAGALAIGQYIRSSNYVAGLSGWNIHSDGNAEFGAASIRGQLAASQINANGLTIRKPDGSVILDASGTGTPIHFSSVLADGGWLNSGISITVNANGTLSVSGGPSVGGGVTLSGIGAGAMAAINAITEANASTYLSGAIINLANINLASINTLAALSSYLGTVEIAAGGYLRSGQTAWSTGSGFWLGWVGSGPGEPGFSIGSSSAYLRYKPSTGLELKLDGMTASMNTSTTYTNVSNGGPRDYGYATVSVSGGVSPYAYSWAIVSASFDNGSGTEGIPTVGMTSVSTNQAYFRGIGSNGYVRMLVECIATDANGRSVRAVGTVEVLHGTYMP
jgi:hypothetical protein